MEIFKVLLIVTIVTLAACTSTSPVLSGAEAEAEARELATATAQLYGVDASQVIISNISKRKTMGGYMLTTTFFDAVVAGTKYRCKVEGTMFELIELHPICAQSDATTNTAQSRNSNFNGTSNTQSSNYSEQQNAGSAKIREAQIILNNLGLDAGKADGLAGPRTEKAIRNFQKISGLPPTGVLDENTFSALRTANSNVD